MSSFDLTAEHWIALVVVAVVFIFVDRVVR